MEYNLLQNGVYWGYNPFTNRLLTSWDIQVVNQPIIAVKESIDPKYQQDIPIIFLVNSYISLTFVQKTPKHCSQLYLSTIR